LEGHQPGIYFGQSKIPWKTYNLRLGLTPMGKGGVARIGVSMEKFP
jgi:hypothetical protein